jgi:hypothetical protein
VSGQQTFEEDLYHPGSLAGIHDKTGLVAWDSIYWNSLRIMDKVGNKSMNKVSQYQQCMEWAQCTLQSSFTALLWWKSSVGMEWLWHGLHYGKGSHQLTNTLDKALQRR